MAEFKRFTEALERKGTARVVSVTVKAVVYNCSGRFWFTDMMLQEGGCLTGYAVHTSESAAKLEKDGQTAVPRHYNGIVRNNATIIYPNTGTESTGLDVYLYPQQDIGELSIAHQHGAHKAVFPAVHGGDTLALLASSHQCLKNGNDTLKQGWFQYSTPGDNRHEVVLGDGKRANILVELQEMQEGVRL